MKAPALLLRPLRLLFNWAVTLQKDDPDCIEMEKIGLPGPLTLTDARLLFLFVV